MSTTHPHSVDIAAAADKLHGFDRPNLSLRVDTFGDKERKIQALLRRVEFADKPGIVYVATHKHAEDLAADLRQMDIDAVCYHGGMKPKEREEIQNKFLSGEVPVLVATNAFGMGVDKPDIRFVYHADVSDSLDEYCQEIGRAGRDGEPAEAVLFYRSQDISAQQFKTGPVHVDHESLETVFNALGHHRKPIPREKLQEETGISARKMVSLLQKLEETGALAFTKDGKLQLATYRPFAQVIEEAEQQQQFLREMRQRRLRQMQAYAESRSCRRACLLRLLGGETQGPCGNCDRCEQLGVLARAA
jgi:ATP-dependent DNA helicase RecQ